MKIRFFFATLALMLTTQASAQEQKKLYKWTDEKGNLHFSDEPHPGAKEIPLKQVPTIKMKMISSDGITIKEDSRDYDEGDDLSAGGSKYYSQLSLSEPLDKSVVRNNAGAISFSASLQPVLGKGHSVRIFLDGKPLDKEPASMIATIEGVAFGEHTAYFVVFDNKGNTIQTSETSRFHLLNKINKKKN